MFIDDFSPAPVDAVAAMKLLSDLPQDPEDPERFKQLANDVRSAEFHNHYGVIIAVYWLLAHRRWEPCLADAFMAIYVLRDAPKTRTMVAGHVQQWIRQHPAKRVLLDAWKHVTK